MRVSSVPLSTRDVLSGLSNAGVLCNCSVGGEGESRLTNLNPISPTNPMITIIPIIKIAESLFPEPDEDEEDDPL